MTELLEMPVAVEKLESVSFCDAVSLTVVGSVRDSYCSESPNRTICFLICCVIVSWRGSCLCFDIRFLILGKGPSPRYNTAMPASIAPIVRPGGGIFFVCYKSTTRGDEKMADQRVDISGPVSIDSDSKYRVAFDLALKIDSYSEVTMDKKDKKYWINLYLDCRAAVFHGKEPTR